MKIGELAPEIEGKSLDGKAMKLSDFRGKVVLLVFWFKSCGPCLADVPQHRALVERHKGKPFVILGINSDDDGEAARKVAAKEGMTWPSFWDGDHGPIVKRWQVRAWPTMYLLDEKGVIRYGGDYLLRIGTRNGPDGKPIQFWRLDEAVEDLLKDTSNKK
jgi:peroxiredoxin